jgi:transcription initiation factor IIF auxiliary subunit
MVEEAKPGEYKLKIKIKRQDQKTEKSITHDINLLAAPIETKTEPILTTLKNTDEKQESLEYSEKSSYISGIQLTTVYKSTSQRSKEMIPHFIIIFLLGFNIFLIFKKMD